MIELPIKSIEAVNQNPKKLAFISHPKIGKTSLLSKLQNCLIIDLEDSAEFYGGLFVNVVKIAKEKNISMLEAYKLVIQSLEEQKKNNGGKPVYDYIALDSITVLQDIAKELALILYKQTAMGKAFTGTDITLLPQGGGEGWLRSAFEKLYSPLSNYCNKCLILAGHVKASSINKNGQDISALDINLRGQLKLITTSQMDAIGFMFRDKGTQNNIMSFKGHEQNLIAGSRCHHLSGQEFVISELKDKELITYWDKIFI